MFGLVKRGDVVPSSAVNEGIIKPDWLRTNPVGEKPLAVPVSTHTIAAVNFMLERLERKGLEDQWKWVRP
jgi:hypothetical protein